MDRSAIIDGLKMTRDLCVFDPSTGEEIEPHLLNDINRATYDACKGALEILEQLDTDSDTISRKAVIDAIDEWKEACADNGHKETVSDIKLIRKDFIELPPVTPKQRTGKWLDANICGELPVIVCDQCNTFYPLSFGEFHNFCPNCGAKMEGDAE